MKLFSKYLLFHNEFGTLKFITIFYKTKKEKNFKWNFCSSNNLGILTVFYLFLELIDDITDGVANTQNKLKRTTAKTAKVTKKAGSCGENL